MYIHTNTNAMFAAMQSCPKQESFSGIR